MSIPSLLSCVTSPRGDPQDGPLDPTRQLSRFALQGGADNGRAQQVLTNNIQTHHFGAWVGAGVILGEPCSTDSRRRPGAAEGAVDAPVPRALEGGGVTGGVEGRCAKAPMELGKKRGTSRCEYSTGEPDHYWDMIVSFGGGMSSWRIKEYQGYVFMV